jgi:LAO/AO transport system kinase
MRALAQITSALRIFGQHGHPDHAQSVRAAGAAELRQWQPKVLQLSALAGTGLDAFWAAVQEFKHWQTASGQLTQRREKQALAWMWERIEAGLRQSFRQHPRVRALLPEVTGQVAAGRLPASAAARSLLAAACLQEPTIL